jgi:tetratricopeptide (TPR) repeat protein
LRPVSYYKEKNIMAKNKGKDNNEINVGEVYTKTEQFVDKNSKALTYFIGGAAILIIGAIGVKSLILDPAIDFALYGDGFSEGLVDIIEDYSGTYAASRASYQVGIANRDMGLFEVAIEAFKNVDLNDDVIAPYALTGIGDCYTDLGDFAAAEGYFDNAAHLADGGLAHEVLAPSIHYKRALVLIELDRVPEAKIALTHIVSDHPESKYKATAEALNATL